MQLLWRLFWPTKLRPKKNEAIEEKDAANEAFAEMLLDNMDKEDAVDFKRDMKIGQKEKAVKKRKWQKMRQDAIDAPWTQQSADTTKILLL